MKLKYCVCVAVVGAILAATPVTAHPFFTPFLSVDINGYNADGGQSKGPTEPGFQDFEAGQGLFVPAAARWDNSGAAGLTNVFPTSDGNITVNMRGIAPDSTLFARNRGANSGGLPAMHQDFAAAQRGLSGFGQNYIRLQLSGLVPFQTYEFTGFSREPAFNSATDHVGSAPLASYASWTDIATLGGVDGPGPWMNANFGPQSVYQPIYTDHDMNPATPDVDTGYKNPIPSKGRSPVSGPDSLSASDPYHHSLSFMTTANAVGNIVVYNWSDPNGYGATSHGATLLNGFQLGRAPGRPLVYEGFDYSPSGADLLGSAGGYGFSGPWGSASATANYDVGAGSLPYSRLATTGSRVTTGANSSAIGSIGRTLSTPIGQAGTTQYVSFIVRPEGTLNEGQFNGFFGLRLETTSSNDLFVGKPGAGAINQFALENAGGTLQHASGTTVEVGEEYLLVLRADFTTGNDVFTLYVNPTPGAPEPATGTVKNDVNIGIINQLFLYATGAFSIDEIRIGPSFADVVPPLPGDYNLNGTVDAADYTVWRDTLGQVGAGLVADGNQNGVVDAADYDVWKANFGHPTGNGAGASMNAAIPEPATLVLLILATAGWCRRRDRDE